MRPQQRQSLDRIVECAAVVSWADLMHDADSGLIHIDYGFSPRDSIEYLKLGSSKTRATGIERVNTGCLLLRSTPAEFTLRMDINLTIWRTTWN